MKKKIDIKKIFGQNLKKLREKENLTQEQLAEALGLQSYQTVNRIENGKTFVTVALFEKICIHFDIEPYVMLLKQKQVYSPESLDKIDEIKGKIDQIYSLLKK